MKQEKFPITVTERGVCAKIRKVIKRKNGVSYPSFVVDYVSLGKRKQVWRSDLAKAKTVARDACRKISNGDHLVLELKSQDRLIYLRAIEPLANTGIHLDVATREYATAAKCLPEGVTIMDAVDFYRRRNAAALEKRTVQQVVDEMIKVKEAARLSDVHLKDLSGRLNRFAENFNVNISDVSGSLLQKWLDNLKGSGRTKQNYLRHVAALFRFAIGRKYLPKDAIDEVEAVQMPKQDADEIEIFTPDEMRELLAAARPEMVPWLAIAGFAGLRSAEINRLDWSEVKLKEGFIEIKASKAKTAARRLVPITDNLAEWLKPYATDSGSVANFESWWNQLPKTVDAVNEKRKQVATERGMDEGTVKPFTWRHNGLRHSFCSYRLAAIKNAAQVALEAGNSPTMIFKHYRQVVTEVEAARWFAIVPLVKTNARKLALN